MKEKLKSIAVNREVLGYIASIAIMIVLSLAFFYPDSIQGNGLNQYDMMQGTANGEEIRRYREETGIQSRWTNSLFSGMPTFQISPTYTSDSLFKWIDTAMRCGLPAPSGYLFSMMFGFLVMCVCMKIKWYYALIGAIAWGFSSYFIIIIGAGHLWKFFTLTYVPPVIGGLVMTYRGHLLSGSAISALFAMMQIASNHVQMSYYFLFVIIGLVIAYLVKGIKEGKFRKWCYATLCLAGAGVLAVAANSPSLYNTYKYSKETIRGQHSLLTTDDNRDTRSGLDKDYITTYSYGRSESFTLLIPNIKGGASAKPIDGQLKFLSVLDLPQGQDAVSSGTLNGYETQFLPYTSQYFGEPESTNGPVYVGAIICALFLLGCFIVKGPLKWTLLVMTILSILLAMGRNAMWLTDFFIDYVPMYKNFRTPESILVIAEFCMPLLGILGLAKFLKAEEPFKEYKSQIWLAFGIPAFFCILGLLFPSIYGEAVTKSDVVSQYNVESPALYQTISSIRYSLVTADSIRSLIFILISFGILWLMNVGIFPKWVAVMGVGVLITGDLYSADKRYLNHESFTTKTVSAEEQFPLSDNDKKILSDTSMNFRVLDIPRFQSPAPSYHHKMTGGYHAAKLTRYNDLIDRHLINFQRGNISEADINIINMLNTKYIIGTDNRLIVNPDALGNAWFVDEINWVMTPDDEMDALEIINPAVTAAIADEFKDIMKVPSGMAQKGDTIFETSYTPDKLTYHSRTSADNSLVVFSEIYFPWGWKATVDGQEVPIARADYVLRAINVPKGEHKIEMEFRPESVSSTQGIAYASIILIYLLAGGALAYPLVKDTKPKKTDV